MKQDEIAKKLDEVMVKLNTIERLLLQFHDQVKEDDKDQQELDEYRREMGYKFRFTKNFPWSNKE